MPNFKATGLTFYSHFICMRLFFYPLSGYGQHHGELKINTLDAFARNHYVEIDWDLSSRQVKTGATLEKTTNGIEYVELKNVAKLKVVKNRVNFQIIDYNADEGRKMYRIKTLIM
ncbi:MAG: hypothetical protein JKY42_10885 [Flavobacteriales bacterium]|nr:hypothetical protein [Flavobacteriales bacterium]